MSKFKKRDQKFVDDLSNITNYKCKTEKLLRVYDRIANGFHEILSKTPCTLHHNVANVLSEFVEDEREDHTKQDKIVDICCGTGLMGKVLRNCGFSGRIDGHDGSIGMINIAKSTGYYNQFCSFTIEPNITISEPMVAFYDIITICYSLYPNHLQIDCIVPLLDCIRAGGFIALNLDEKSDPEVKEYNSKFIQLAKKLEDKEIWKCLKVFQDKTACLAIEGLSLTVDQSKYTSSTIFLFKKL